MTQAHVPHPYFPPSLLLPLYVAPVYSTTQIFGIFFVGVFVTLIISSLLIRRKTQSTTTQLVFLWFIACGFIHSIIEGFYAYHYREIAGQTYLLADCWKEYSYSDSRYLAGDSFIVVMETITAAAWGPLSFLVAYWIYTSHPARHILAFLISTGQLYGDVLYYATSLFEGATHTSPDAIYFWGYFVGLNAPWIIIPLLIMWGSAKEITRCVRVVESTNNKKKAK